jgi:integrase
MRGRQIELDILSGHFDDSLERYKPSQGKVTPKNDDFTPITPITPIGPDLAELWEKYGVFKRPQVSQTTWAKDFSRHRRHIENLPSQSLDDAVAIRDWLTANLPPNAAKRVLTQLSACCDWALGSGLIKTNPFKGMATSVKLPKAQKSDDGDISPFSAQERDQIIAGFESNRYYTHYAPLVKFLFWTGCRPSEALGLQWKHISQDTQWISFEQALTESERGLRIKEGLKTQERRRFPCNERLRGLLTTIKPDVCDPQALVFPSPEGKWIDFHNFRNRAWEKVLEQVGVPYKKPYQCRHTFITLALEAGLDAKDVARLVGNSPEVIYRHYAGGKRELSVPEF